MGALAVGAGLAVVGGAAIEAATTFDQNMQRIAALTDTSTAQMQSYKQSILEMAPALDQSPTALAQGLYFVISAGYKGADALNILSLSAKAAAANMAPMKDVSDLLTTAMNAYRVQGLSAGHAMDDLTKIVVNGKVTMASLATSFGFVAVTAANAGLSFDEASTAVSALSQIAGQHGSRRVMMDLDNALRHLGPQMEKVSASAKTMKGLKEPWDAAAFAAMNFEQKLQYIAKETGGIGYLDKTQAAAYEATGNLQNLAQATAHANSNFMTLVGGAAAFLPMAMLLGDKMKSYDAILKQMGGNGEATNEAFIRMRDSTGQQANMVKVMGETILTEIGLHMLPYLNKLLMAVYHVGDALSSWLSKAQNIQTLKWALIGIAVVAGAVLIPALIGLITTIGPVLLAIVGITAGGIVLGTVIRQIVQHFGGWQAILARLHPIIVLVQQALADAGQQIKQAFADPAIAQAWAQLQSVLPQLLPLLKALAIIIGVILFIGLKEAVLEIQLFAKVLPIAMDVISALVVVLGALGQALLWAFDGSHWAAIWQAITKGAAQTWQQITGAIGQVVSGIAHGIQALVGGVVGAFQRLVGTVRHWEQEIEAAVVKAAAWLYAHNTYVKAFVDHVVGWWNFLTKKIPQLLQQFVGEITRRWQNLVGWADFIWRTISSHVVAWWNYLRDQIAERIARIEAFLMHRWNNLVAWAEFIWKKLVENVLRPINNARKAVQTAIQQHIIDPITTFFTNLLTNAEKWGGNLIDSFIKGLQGKGDTLKKNLENVAKNIAAFLGFHSPTKEGPGRTADQWAPNLIKMYAQGITSALPILQTAVGRAAGTISSGLTAAGARAGAAGTAAMGPTIASVTSASSTTINAHFPNATNAAAIEAAFTSLMQKQERATARATRRAGYGGGLRAGLASIA